MQKKLTRNQESKIFDELGQQLDYCMNQMTTFNIDEIQDGSDFIMELVKSPDQVKRSFLQQKVNEVISLYLQIISQVFSEGINYEIDIEQYKLLFDPLIELCSDKTLVEKVSSETLDYLIELIIVNLVQADQEQKMN